MAKIYKSVLDIIGNTPLVEAEKIAKKNQVQAKILMKLEYLNPTGSVKDRAAKAMIEVAEQEGLLKPGGVIIEATSGNTGIGLASIAAVKGYRLILTMPETMSEERRNILKAYGAEVILTKGSEGMEGAVKEAKELVKIIENSYMPEQFNNYVNSEGHRKTTAVEIWEDTKGAVDIFVAGVGTGGTITGVGRYLKEKKPQVQVIAVEPEDSPMLSAGKKGSHMIPGIGAGFIPKILDTKVYDEVIKVSNEEAIVLAKEIGTEEGILVGVSSGATLAAALQVAKREENQNKTIVVILPDSADRYYSTSLFIK